MLFLLFFLLPENLKGLCLYNKLRHYIKESRKNGAPFFYNLSP